MHGAGQARFEKRELARLEDASAAEVLRWAVERFQPGKLALSSAFGPGSAVLLHLLADVAPTLPVLFVDTLHHFPETLEHVERVTWRYGLDVRIHRAAASREAFEAEHGRRLWQRDLERYQRLTKVEPFRRATEPFAGWITGRRRDQSATRTGLPVVELGEKVRINPLARWTGADVWEFIRAHDLPYNPLHDQGYASVGDEPLTSPVLADEHERSGRWRGTGRLECGIHV